MSWLPGQDPIPGDTLSCDAIEHVIVPRSRDLGGFEVRRALPSAQKRWSGPFIFFDQMGRREFLIGKRHRRAAASAHRARHRHLPVRRRDVASRQPGHVGGHPARRGQPDDGRPRHRAFRARERARPSSTRGGLFGIQAWVALPKAHEETAPAFAHHGADELPRIAGEGKRVRLIMGSAYGARSPVEFPHESLYAEAVLAPGAVLPLDPDYDERAVYVVSGEIDIAGTTFEAGRLLVFKPGDRISILALAQSRLMLVGGEPMDGPRHIWWNFVSSSKERIEAAKADWRAKRFALVPGDEKEFIPLPE